MTMRQRLAPPARIALAFLAFGVLWILVSDTLVEAAFPRSGASPPAQTIKGLVFVTLSALLVLVLARREHRRKESLASIERERETLAAALEQTAEGVALTDASGRILYVNPAFTRLTAYSTRDLVGQTPAPPASPDTARDAAASNALTRSSWVELAAAGTWKGRVAHTKKTGEPYTAELLISPIAAPGLARYVVIERDISREVELERELQQSQKMEAIGRLAGGVAHDFNNILTAISGFTMLAQESLPEDSPARADLSQVVDAAGRAADLTRQLLGFARKQTAQPRVLDLGRTIVPMLELLRRVIGEHITVEAQFATNPWPVHIDPTQLDQILTNLVVNARDAITGPGRILVRVDNASLQTSEVPQRRGDWVVLIVEDNGKGMSKETLERAFEPFFTTKAEGHGTGLGLATVYGIVDQNGGFIDVRSEPGQGTTFLVHLPRHAGVATTREAPHVSASTLASSKSDTILVVEDDALLRALIERLLRQAGYTVHTAASGMAALELTGLGPVDLLLTDVIMPGMNGHELFAALSLRRPGLRCLYVSGYPRDVLATQGLVPLDVELLPKPFSHDALVRKVGELIARRQPDPAQPSG